MIMVQELLSFAVPLIFVFAIVYGAFEISKIFENKKIGGLIALAVSFFAISSETVLTMINQFLPYAALFFIVVFFIGFVLSPFRGKGEKKTDYTMVIIVIALVLIFLINQGYDMISPLLPSGFLIGSENFMAIAGLVLIIAIFWTAYKKKGE